MTGVEENPGRRRRWGLGLAALAVAALAPVQGAAGPFRIVTDGPESVWVLDAGSGKVTWCRLAAAAGPKVLDVFGNERQVRPETPRRAKPVCSVALRPEPGGEGSVRLGRFGFGSDYDMLDGYGGYGGYGVDPVDISDGQVLIVRPKRVNINTY
jgi:hypothetical protein